ncbi:hypothetical protein C7293_10425 [filamentous cyanobacterium CCT1]|nr:hypothetical protein C7293_10425 [filamentous cyanobacterium CCT1]PSN76044.1 hypothetical protein C8B47_29390 [filamentous cyanobacterium CCP4]
MGLVGATLTGSLLLATLGHQAQAQTGSAATVTEILDSDQVYIQNRAAQVNSVAQQRQQVRTRAARTSLRFNSGAVARLAHNSSLVVGQCAQLNRGTLLVNGTLNGCSTSTVAGVRGTIYTIEVTEAGETIIQVFEGEVVVERNLDPVTVDPMADDFDPLDPTLDPVVPGTDPVVPFVNPMEPPASPGTSPGIDPPGTSPGIDPPTGPTTGPMGNVPGVKPADGLLAVAQLRLKQDDPLDSSADPASLPEANPDGEAVDFAEDDSLTIAEGQQVIIDAEDDEAVISPLSPEDFIDLLEGPLINGFALEIPGMANLRRSFEQLFPGVPLPSYWVPSIPSPPIRFPFPF